MSYEQGIEKAAKTMADWGLFTDSQEADEKVARAAVETFLSAQPTIKWCEAHNMQRLDDADACMEEGLPAGSPDNPQFDCRIVEVRIVERETP